MSQYKDKKEFAASIGVPVDDVTDEDFAEVNAIPDEDFADIDEAEDDTFPGDQPDAPKVLESEESEESEESGNGDGDIPEALMGVITEKYYPRELVDGNVLDKSHPLHEQFVKASQEGRDLKTKLNQVTKEFESLQSDIKSGKRTLANDPEKGIYDGISWDDVDDGTYTANEYFNARDAYNRSSREAEIAKQNAEQQWEAEKVAAQKLGYNEEQLSEVLETFDPEKGRSFTVSEGAMILEIQKAGGLDKYRQGLIDEGVAKGQKEALDHVRSNANHDTDFNSEAGVVKDPTNVSKFNLNADVDKMSDAELEAWELDWKAAYDRGEINIGPNGEQR